jgi:hypothetical protein
MQREGCVVDDLLSNGWNDAIDAVVYQSNCREIWRDGLLTL